MSRLHSRESHSHRAPFQTEFLEARRLFTAIYPTNLEQYTIELINRARANPAAEAARYGISLNEGLAAGTISTDAKQPLAINPFLTDGAREHSQWMLSSGVFSHTGSGGSTPNNRMSAAGYNFVAPWTWAENIAWRSFNGSSLTQSLADQLQKDLFVDSPVPGRGHRTDMLNTAVRETGAGFVSGAFDGYAHAGMLTTDFASTAGNPFFTGVAYLDTITKDNFYTPGEGLSGVTVTATRLSDSAVFSTTTFLSGGYSFQVPPGTYQVMASGHGLAQPTAFATVNIGSQNIKKDFVQTVAAPPPVADTKRPTAALSRALRLRSQVRYDPFEVTYSDNQSLDGLSFDNFDIVVSGPGGFGRYANVDLADRGGSGTPQTVNYEIKGPGGSWDAADNGVYTITLQRRQIADMTGNTANSVTLGAFSVVIRGATSSPVAVMASPAAFSIQKKNLDQSPVFA